MSTRCGGMPIDVEVTTTQDSSNRFTHCWKMQNESNWRTGNIQAPEGADHDLHFTIKDEAQIGARFKSKVKSAFGAHKGNGCPGAGSSAGGEIDFKSSHVVQQGKRMIIRDCNHLRDDLKYALFFDSDSGPLKYDPIIENQGGGPPTVSET